jgi:hypothetical protein
MPIPPPIQALERAIGAEPAGTSPASSHFLAGEVPAASAASKSSAAWAYGKIASDKIREHAIFALTQNKDSEGTWKLMASVAHNDKSPRVRGQALFWLAQRAGKKDRRIGD